MVRGTLLALGSSSSLNRFRLSSNLLHLKWVFSLFFLKKRILSLLLYIKMEQSASSSDLTIRYRAPRPWKVPSFFREIWISGSPQFLRNMSCLIPVNIKGWGPIWRRRCLSPRFWTTLKKGLVISTDCPYASSFQTPHHKNPGIIKHNLCHIGETYLKFLRFHNQLN